MPNPIKQISLVLLCAAAVAGCEPTVANRGDMLDADALAQVKPGVTTREEVATTLGTPTAVSTFDDKIWYYVGRETEQYSFFDPEVVKQRAVEVDFDDQGVVAKVANIDLSKAADVSPVERATPSFGQHNTLLRELLGDISHPVPDLSNQTGNH